MRWVDIEAYFNNLVRLGREDAWERIGTELDSMRFATMCIALGLDPCEGKVRVLEVIAKDDFED